MSVDALCGLGVVLHPNGSFRKLGVPYLGSFKDPIM